MKNIIQIAGCIIFFVGITVHGGALDLSRLILRAYPSFCDKGAATFIHTIRSNEGGYCTNDIGAALASFVCGYNELKNTKCASNTSSLLNKYPSKSIAQAKIELSSEMTCEFLAKNFSNVAKNDCRIALNAAKVTLPGPSPKNEPSLPSSSGPLNKPDGVEGTLALLRGMSVNYFCEKFDSDYKGDRVALETAVKVLCAFDKTGGSTCGMDIIKKVDACTAPKKPEGIQETLGYFRNMSRRNFCEVFKTTYKSDRVKLETEFKALCAFNNKENVASCGEEIAKKIDACR